MWPRTAETRGTLQSRTSDRHVLAETGPWFMSVRGTTASVVHLRTFHLQS